MSLRREIEEAEWEQAHWDKVRREQERKCNLSMWDRIEEAELSDDLKDILHRLAAHTKIDETGG